MIIGSKCGFKGKLVWEHRSKGGLVLARGVVPNQVKDEGINEALEILFSTNNQAVWYMGLIDAAGYTNVATTDTYADLFANTLLWDELNADSYVTTLNTLRRPIIWSAAAGGLIDSSAFPTTFQITSNGDGASIQGIFVGSQEDYTSGLGWMWSTIILPSPRLLAQGDQLLFGYEVSLGRV